MSEELRVKSESTGLVSVILDAEMKAEALREEAKKYEAEAELGRAKLLELFKAKGLKTVSLEDGSRVTVAVRPLNIKITDSEALMASLAEYNVVEALTKEVPAHREVNEPIFKAWVKEKGDVDLGLRGIEVKRTEYLQIKKGT